MGSPNVKHLAADGATVLQQKNWGAFASSLTVEVLSAKLKFAVENNGTRVLGIAPFGGFFLEVQQIGDNDGFTFVNFAVDFFYNGTISKPFGLGLDSGGQPNGAPTVIDAGAGAAWGSTGNKGIRVSAKNATGETIGSNEAVFNVSNVATKKQYDWTATPGATKYEVYRTDTPGTYGATTFRAELIGNGNTSFTDDGSATLAGTPPAANTTGGAGPAYGVPPGDPGAFSQDTRTIALDPTGLRVGEQFFYWADLRIPPGTGEDDNTRASRRRFREI